MGKNDPVAYKLEDIAYAFHRVGTIKLGEQCPSCCFREKSEGGPFDWGFQEVSYSVRFEEKSGIYMCMEASALTRNLGTKQHDRRRLMGLLQQANQEDGFLGSVEGLRFEEDEHDIQVRANRLIIKGKSFVEEDLYGGMRKTLMIPILEFIRPEEFVQR